jgi:hypothetical protein
MKTKLTLRLDEELIELAKQEASSRGMSISQMVAKFFQGLKAQRQKTEASQYGPLTSEMVGMLKGTKVSEEDYRRHVEKKYR